MGDPFGVLKSTYPFTKAGPVQIDQNRVWEFAEGITPKALADKQSAIRFNFPGWSVEDKVALILIFNAINFSFWPERGKPIWTIQDAHGKILDRSTAALWCLENFYQRQSYCPVDFSILRNLTGKEIEEIFKGRDGSELRMLEERFQCLHELGENLPIDSRENMERHLRDFWNQSAVNIVKNLTFLVPSFNDVVDIGEGYTVIFYKRAQLTASMINQILVEEGSPLALPDIGELTVFADYRDPQILREERTLVYQKDLAEAVDNEEEIPPQSTAELCIRSATVWVAEYIRRHLEGRFQTPITAVQVDSFLWNRARELKDTMRPHHRTRTIYY